MDKDSKRDISYLATTEQHYSITACSGKSQRQGAKAATQATYPTTSQTAMQSLFNLVNPLSHRHASVDIGQSVQKSKKRSIHQSLRNIPTNTTTMHIRRSTARDLHLGIWHSTRPVYRILSVSARRGSVGNVLLGVRPPAPLLPIHPSIYYVSIAFCANIRPRPSARQLDASSVNPTGVGTEEEEGKLGGARGRS